MILDYEVVQFGLETINNVSNVITEIRFLHTIKPSENEPVSIKKLYVIHLEYNDENYYTQDNVNKEIVRNIIENKLGEKQIQHMEKLITDEYNANVKQYVNVSL